MCQRRREPGVTASRTNQSHTRSRWQGKIDGCCECYKRAGIDRTPPRRATEAQKEVLDLLGSSGWAHPAVAASRDTTFVPWHCGYAPVGSFPGRAYFQVPGTVDTAFCCPSYVVEFDNALLEPNPSAGSFSRRIGYRHVCSAAESVMIFVLMVFSRHKVLPTS